MPPFVYDPERAPEKAAWAEAKESERVAAVEAHHLGVTPATKRSRLHAAIHVVVEDQVAQGEPPEVAQALERLIRGGRTRHEALHAIGQLVSTAMERTLATGRYDGKAYREALKSLTPGSADVGDLGNA